MILGGVGMATTMTPMTAAVLSSVPVDKAGVGSGMLNTFRQVGGALGIAAHGGDPRRAGRTRLWPTVPRRSTRS